MTIFIVTIVLAVILAVLAYPFFAQRGGRATMEDAAEELAQRLRRSRDRVYEEIRVLQQEYFLETVSQEEYTEQLQAARLRAAELLAQQRQVQQTLLSIGEDVEEQMRLAGDGGRKP